MRHESSAYSVGTRLCTVQGTSVESLTQRALSSRTTPCETAVSLKRLSSYSIPATRVCAPSSNVPRSRTDVRVSRGDSLLGRPPESVLVM